MTDEHSTSLTSGALLSLPQKNIFAGCAWRLGLAVQREIILDSLGLKDLEKLNLGSNHQASSRLTYNNFANAEIKWNNYFSDWDFDQAPI